jgi:formylglycine-generating enzyme required for sulfatase activity
MKTLSFRILLLLLLSWPLSSFAAQQYVRGDVNGNKRVDIEDVTTMVSRLLSNNGKYIVECDVNRDRKFNISDVTELINYLLSGNWSTPDNLDPPYPDGTEIYTVNGVSFAMLPVEGGTFMMGYGDKALIYPGSHASHQVTLSSFKIGVTEVTQALWVAVMGNNPSPDQSDVDHLPVSNVSWHDCKTFIQRLNELTGEHFNFPTDAQWEFAARGGNLSQGYLYAGSDDVDEVAWWPDEEAGLTWHPAMVGQKKANELGLYDMSGNMSEWCYDDWDYWTVNSIDEEPLVDPVYERDNVINESMRHRVMRGGSRCDMSALELEYLTVYSRNYPFVYTVNNQYGLRLALW